MAKIHLLACAIMATAALTACDDTTDTLGQSLTNNVDIFQTATDTFEVSTRSLAVDSVLSRSQYSYLGHVKDTETGTYVTSNFTSQFAILEDIYRNEGYFPVADSMASRGTQGEIIADSCRLRIYINTYVGDSLNPMKLTAYELAAPVVASKTYYTNFDPEKEGLLRTDANAIKRNKLYTPVDLNLTDSVRNLINTSSSSYYKPITISLNDEYTDAQGNTYNNYGSYILQSYYRHPEYFKNSLAFAQNVCPGFYYKSTGGVGVMTQVYMTDLAISYRYYAAPDSAVTATTSLMGTEEVKRTTSIVNDKAHLAQLAADESCTYLKAPAGIFTEVTLPVESIMQGHDGDTISSAKVIFHAMNATDDDNQFEVPTEVMLLPKDSLFKFFEDGDLPDNIRSYVASYSSSYNTYTFNNIASLIGEMWKAKGSSADWNKAVLLPVSRNYSTTSSSTSSTLVSVTNEMSLKSTRLVRGYTAEEKASGLGADHDPITISVVYNKFSK